MITEMEMKALIQRAEAQRKAYLSLGAPGEPAAQQIRRAIWDAEKAILHDRPSEMERTYRNLKAITP